jgi:hypothetical protein
MNCYGDIYCNKGKQLQEEYQVCSSIWVQNMEGCTDNYTESANIYKQVS